MFSVAAVSSPTKKVDNKAKRASDLEWKIRETNAGIFHWGESQQSTRRDSYERNDKTFLFFVRGFLLNETQYAPVAGDLAAC